MKTVSKNQYVNIFLGLFLSFVSLQWASSLSTSKLSSIKLKNPYDLSVTPKIDNLLLTCTPLKLRNPIYSSQSISKRKRCNPCLQETNDGNNESEMDRREAAFTMIGNLWSRGVIPTAVISTLFSFPFQPNQAAHATYGSDANIQLPNVVEGVSNRINKQCLVESLGNRECLVYMDPENQLYKGADSDILLTRLEKSSVALASLPELIKTKQWSKIRGVITGPMGNLLTTMNDLAKLSERPDEALILAKKVKSDLFAISAAVEKKQADLVGKAHKSTTDDLIAFVSSL